jgi:hypothetical protein
MMHESFHIRVTTQMEYKLFVVHLTVVYDLIKCFGKYWEYSRYFV